MHCLWNYLFHTVDEAVVNIKQRAVPELQPPGELWLIEITEKPNREICEQYTFIVKALSRAEESCQARQKKRQVG